jgi:type I restriction enzyme S subunit
LPRITAEKADELGRHKLQRGDILFARRGVQATGQVAYVGDPEEGFLCGTGAIRLRVRREDKAVSPEFLSHVLANPTSIAWFKFHAIGATMPNLNEDIIKAFPILLPPISEQREIAHILGTLDDKIELNRRMNETLEAMARALFKSWFVAFDPVRAKAEGRDPGLPQHLADLFPDSFEDSESGEIPNWWKAARVGDLLTLNRSPINPGASPDEVFDHYSIPAFDEGRRPKVECGASIKSSKFVVPAGAVLLSKLNPRFPRVWMPSPTSHRRAICSTEFLVAVPQSRVSRELLYCLFSNFDFSGRVETLVTGTSSSHQRVKPESLLAIHAVAPTDAVTDAFTSTVAPWFQRWALALDESSTLGELRDTLLPKLISGELRVKDAERIAVEAGA